MRRMMRGAAFASKGNVRVEHSANSRQNWRIEVGSFIILTATTTASGSVAVAFSRKFGAAPEVLVGGQFDAGSGQTVVLGRRTITASGFVAQIKTTTAVVFGTAANYFGDYIAIGTD